MPKSEGQGFKRGVITCRNAEDSRLSYRGGDVKFHSQISEPDLAKVLGNAGLIPFQFQNFDALDSLG